MHPILEHLQLKTRRYFLQHNMLGLGGLALSSLMGGSTKAASSQSPGPHFHGKAKRVIYLHMTGSPPNLDLFDYKPSLIRHHGEACPESFLAGREFAFTSGTPTLLGTPQKFSRAGEAGFWMS
ncbi:MAG: DUF1501 domain-containing protein, partial [bacterium]|nr:DUF1501 domain-containing protein [bacterium]